MDLNPYAIRRMSIILLLGPPESFHVSLYWKDYCFNKMRIMLKVNIYYHLVFYYAHYLWFLHISIFLHHTFDMREDNKFVAFNFSCYWHHGNFIPTNYLSIWNNRVVMAYYSKRHSLFLKKIEVCITIELFPLGSRHHYYHGWCIIFLNWWCLIYLSFVLQGVGCGIYMQSKFIWGVIFYFNILYFYLKV